MKIYVCIPIYRRPEILTLCLNRLTAIREWSDNEIIIFGAGDEADREVFEKYTNKQDKYFICQNRPVSNKFNYLFEQLRELEFDYATIVGSDDLISDYGWELSEYYMRKLEYHLIGFVDINFYNINTAKAGYYIARKGAFNKTVGCFRFMHKNLLEEGSIDYNPFMNNKNSGIDYSMEEKLMRFDNLKEKRIEIGNYGDIVDVKSNMNINSFDYLKNIFRLAEKQGFPEEIKELLNI